MSGRLPAHSGPRLHDAVVLGISCILNSLSNPNKKNLRLFSRESMLPALVRGLAPSPTFTLATTVTSHSLNKNVYTVLRGQGL